MKILAIDTSTEACSASIMIDDNVIDRYEYAPRRHTELILPMVNDLLSSAQIKLADLDAIAYGRGPGSFTGVRIAASVTQGLAFAGDLPVVPISTLAALAQAVVSTEQHIVSAIDARMGEIYWCAYNVSNNALMQIGEESVTTPEDISVSFSGTCYGTGSGWQSYSEILRNKLKDQLIKFDGQTYPHAKHIATLAGKEFKLGQTVSADQALPVYLRNNVTQ